MLRATPIVLVLLATVCTARADGTAGEVIVVTGSRVPEPTKDEAATVDVIDREQLDTNPSRLADDILRERPDIGTFRRSSSATADPTSQGLNLRGIGPSGVSRALVLQDGIPIVDPFGGWVYWRAINPLALDRIEIQPGAASALFGNYALGGVVDLESRPIDRDSAHVLVAGGMPASERTALAVSKRLGKLALALDGDLFHSHGYDPIADPGAVDHDATSSHASAGVRAKYGDAHASLRYFGEALDAGTAFTTANVQTVRADVGGAIGAARLELFGGYQLFTQDRARVMPDRSAATLASHQVTPSNDQGLSATYQLRSRMLVGIDARRVAGTATDHPAMGDARSAGGEQWFGGVFVEDAVVLADQLILAPALRLDAYANTNAERTGMPIAGTHDAQLDPRLGILWHATDELAVRAAGYRGFRAPTLNELYRPFQVGTVLTDANAQLRAETLWGGEAGVEITLPGVTVRATGFADRLSNPIDNVTLATPLADGAMRMRENLGAARIVGLELSAEWKPAPAWTVRAAELFANATVTAAPGHEELVGNWLAQDPRHRATGSVTYTGWLAATAQVRYLGTQFEDDQNMLPIGAAVLADAFVAKPIAHGFTIYGTIENAFDRRYIVGRSGVDTIGPPRTVELGLRFDR